MMVTRRIAEHRGVGYSRLVHYLCSCCLAAPTTASGSNPNFLCSSLRGAEAPKVFMPMTRPELPTYRSQPRMDACSTATRAFTFGGRTLSRYSCDCCSKISHDGIDTTRERMPSESNFSWALTASETSLPDAMMIT